MHLDTFEALAMLSAIMGILILGTNALKTNLRFYSVHTTAIAAETAIDVSQLTELKDQRQAKQDLSP